MSIVKHITGAACQPRKWSVNMRELTVKLTHKTYPILIENNLFQSAGAVIQRFFPARKVFIVTDSNLASIYGTVLVEQLAKLSTQAGLYVFPAGEGNKSHEQLLKMYEAFSQVEITRKDVVVALGGGVTGDLTGFAASTWLRGTGFLQIPTSLLAMVDSSIGGKVAVNLPVGKNLVGSFYHPEAVLIDPLLLNTLPDRHFSDGMAEVIKHGCIRDKEMFEWLEELGSRDNFMAHAEEIICRNCDIKRLVVQQDERETSLRMILNFGHTFGHAIEKAFHYEKYTHGESVAMGMVFAAELSCRLGYCDADVPQKIRSIVTQYHLPTAWPEVNSEIIQKTVMLDKKAQTDELSLVLIKSIGEVVLEKFPKERIGGWIDEKSNH